MTTSKHTRFAIIASFFYIIMSSFGSCFDPEESNGNRGLMEQYGVDWTTLPQISGNVPTYSNLSSNYRAYGPHLSNGGMSDAAFAEEVGGLFEYNVEEGFFTNTCAARVSHTLNLNGDVIPAMANKTSSGGNGFKYIFRVVDLTQYMYDTYGPPQKQGTNIEDFLGYRGVIIFNTQGTWDDATGHASVWNREVVLGGNYADNPEFYFNNSVNVMLWIEE